MDSLSPAERSQLMARIHATDTQPEIAVRRFLHACGYRYRLHVRTLPGTPDLVFPGRRAVVFVHGCFWHQHTGCSRARLPATRTDFWRAKLEANRQRDARASADLANTGWRVIVVWQCQMKRGIDWARPLVSALGPPGPAPGLSHGHDQLP